MSELAIRPEGDAPAVVQQQQTMQSQAVERLGEWATAAGAAYEVACRLVDTSFVPAAFKNKPYEATAAILSGSEVGLSPMASLRAFDIIQGTAAPRAITLRAIVQSQGHEVWVKESTASRAIVCGRRRGSNVTETSTWTLDRARDLSLLSKSNWKQQPQAMLVARATSEACRLVAADAILGIGYTIEELSDGSDPATPLAAVTEASTTRRMSRPKREEPAVAAEPDADEKPQVNGEEPPPESPLLDTKGKLAKRMFALFGDADITDKELRIAYVSDVVGRVVASSKDMTDDDARKVSKALEAELEVRRQADQPDTYDEPPGWGTP